MRSDFQFKESPLPSEFRKAVRGMVWMFSGTAHSSKSLGGVKAPRKTCFPQPWPHIFAPGEPKLYSDLSLTEFCAGYIAILQQYPDDSNRFPPGALLSHFF